MSDPSLPEDERQRLVDERMDARRAVGAAKRGGNDAPEKRAHDAVDAAKRKLGERGPVWWDDGAEDLNRHMARNTPYADWYGALSEKARADERPRQSRQAR